MGIIDRFLSITPELKKSELQCVGITALHIAGKYEEIYPPELKNLLKVTDNAVSKEEIIQLDSNSQRCIKNTTPDPSSNTNPA